MKLNLRPYQADAVNAAWEYMRTCVSPICLELATASGKSFILAELAYRLASKSGKKILVIGPNKEIVIQNHSKYLLTGEPASIFSASTGRKETKHTVVFGTPQTVINSIDRFKKNYAAIFIDEAHGLSATVKKIVAEMKDENPLLRVVGVSATPYRLGTGYIYADHYLDGVVPEDKTVKPFFAKLVYSIAPKMLIDEGFLTRPIVGAVGEHYDTSGLTMNNMGQFKADQVDQAFTGHGRKTSAIVADVVAQSYNRKTVMLFAATVNHANEIMASLPAELSALVTGETKSKERDRIINAARASKIKYLVSIGALTTGVDIPSVSLVAILRATESASLLQQIIGRGLRLDENKPDCLILDYAENIERHFPDGDIFAPEIKARHAGDSERFTAICELCGGENEFPLRPNPDDYKYDQNGYFTDLAGERIETAVQVKRGYGNIETVYKPLPAHYGRRCSHYHVNRITHEADRCGYYWSYKDCPDCGHKNDVAARRCTQCKAEIVDPNEKLRLEAAQLASDPYRTQTARVLGLSITDWPGINGKPDSIKVEYQIEDKPHSISEWLCPNHSSQWLQSRYAKWCIGALGEQLPPDELLKRRHAVNTPSLLLFRKKRDSKYHEVSGVYWNEVE